MNKFPFLKALTNGKCCEVLQRSFSWDTAEAPANTAVQSAPSFVKTAVRHLFSGGTFIQRHWIYSAAPHIFSDTGKIIEIKIFGLTSLRVAGMWRRNTRMWRLDRRDVMADRKDVTMDRVDVAAVR